MTQTSTETWQNDILGEGWVQHTFDLGADPDGEGTVFATLVKKHTSEAVRGAVLYVHGFSDYFFQTALAQHFHDQGLAFYALDLRKCGRARRPGQTAHYVSDLALYDTELDLAMATVTREHPAAKVLLVAHSTGGLVLPLWLARKPRTDVAGLVLNSPWLDLQGKAWLRSVGTEIIKVVAGRKPFQIFKGPASPYGMSLHSGSHGEWDYDLELKPNAGFPVTMGWLNAVRRGHARLHQGLDVTVPVLVLRSARSWFSDTWTEKTDTADAVLDVKQIARWSGALGRDVTVVAVEGVRHDVFLSQAGPREQAYAELDRWLRARAAF